MLLLPPIGRNALFQNESVTKCRVTIVNISPGYPCNTLERFSKIRFS
jgi:hypothetical protein